MGNTGEEFPDDWFNDPLDPGVGGLWSRWDVDDQNGYWPVFCEGSIDRVASASLVEAASIRSTDAPRGRSETAPLFAPGVQRGSDVDFASAMADPTLKIAPRSCGLIPVMLWADVDFVTFGNLVRQFFRSRAANKRFIHKLFNALKLVEVGAIDVNLIGVSWVADTVIRCNKEVFGRLLGLKAPAGALFHMQGNFPAYSIIELTFSEAREAVPAEALVGADFDNIRFLRHSGRALRRASTEKEVEAVKWIRMRERVRL